MIPKTTNFVNGILSQVSADQCELVFSKTSSGLTRFARNHIHQGTQTETRSLNIRVVLDGRPGSFSTDRFDQDSLAMAIDQACRIALASPAAQRKPALPAEQPLSDSSDYYEVTARAIPADRALVIQQMTGIAAAKGIELSGAISTSENTLCIVNSKGTQSYQEYTVANLNVIASKGHLTGYSNWIGADLAEMPYEQLTVEAMQLADYPYEPAAVPPGTATVILDSYAAGSLMGYLGYLGFGAKAFLEGRSFMTRDIGKKVCSSKLTLWDDPAAAGMITRRFDYEGVEAKKVLLINEGVAENVVTDSVTCTTVEKENTGHALPMPNESGPLPQSLVLAPGKASLQEMIRGTREGIYVRKLHYVNVVEPLSTVLTGMTRDGTFLIRDGELAMPVRSLRFTQNLLQAMSNVLQVGGERRLVPSCCGPALVPPLKIRSFHFTGISEE